MRELCNWKTHESPRMSIEGTVGDSKPMEWVYTDEVGPTKVYSLFRS